MRLSSSVATEFWVNGSRRGTRTPKPKHKLLKIACFPYFTMRPLFLFLPEYVFVWLWQLGHKNLKLLILLSIWSPFIWSTWKRMGLFLHSSISQREHLFSNPFSKSLLYKSEDLYPEFKQKTSSSGVRLALAPLKSLSSFSFVLPFAQLLPLESKWEKSILYSSNLCFINLWLPPVCFNPKETSRDAQLKDCWTWGSRFSFVYFLLLAMLIIR